MESLNSLLEILKYILPSIIVFFTAYILVGKFLQDKLSSELRALKQQPLSIINPLKLQAYERLMIFIERLSPQQLIENSEPRAMNVLQLKHHFVASINAEYNHNVSQQIYVSPQLWTIIKVVKEQTIDLVNTSAEGIAPEKSGVELCKVIVNRLLDNQQQPNQKAIEFLKAEVQIYFA